MKIVSVISLFVFGALLIKGNQNDTIQTRIDHLPTIHVIDNKVDSIVYALNKEVEKVKELQEADKKYYQMELESDQKVMQAQRELVLTLLKRNEVRSNNN